MTTSHRDHEHRLWDGTTIDRTDTEGKPIQVRHEFRFQQGLSRDHAEALRDRRDLAARLRAMALWGAASEDLDAAVEALLAEDKAKAK